MFTHIRNVESVHIDDIEHMSRMKFIYNGSNELWFDKKGSLCVLNATIPDMVDRKRGFLSASTKVNLRSKLCPRWS